MVEETKLIIIEFTNKMLGTVPKNAEVYKVFVASKAVKAELAEEEIGTVEEIEEKGWTGFHKDKDGLFIYSYMLKGFLKSAIEVGMECKQIKKIVAYKKWVDRVVFIEPRKLYFYLQEPDGVLERPLRVMTMQGPRVSLVRSDYVNAGRQLTFNLTIMNNSKGLDWEVIETVFQYGERYGLGQWRGSGGYGTFKVKEIKKLPAK